MFVIAKVRLVKPVRVINTKTGTPMSAGFGFADIGGEKGLPVGVVGFNNLANELSKYGQGNTIRAIRPRHLRESRDRWTFSRRPAWARKRFSPCESPS